jgi:Holliday junction resolvasome RuvABC endonuclease subunit
MNLYNDRILSLDISTKTGWAVMYSGPKEVSIVGYGQTEPIPEPKGEYPERVLAWSYSCFAVIKELIGIYSPDVIVIEQTSKGSKASKTQKLLEWVHYQVAEHLVTYKLKNVYLQTGEWRKLVGSKMTKSEKDRNKYVKEYKAKYLKEHPEEEFKIDKDGKKKKKAVVVYDEQGVRIGKVGKKNVSVRTANEIFGSQLKKPLQRKDEDAAEALLLAYAYHRRKTDAIQTT